MSLRTDPRIWIYKSWLSSKINRPNAEARSSLRESYRYRNAFAPT